MTDGGRLEEADAAPRRYRPRLFFFSRLFASFGLCVLAVWGFVVAFHAASALAQQGRPGVVGLGDLVVSGSSGTVAPPPGSPLAPGVSILDETFFDPNGASIKIFDVRNPGGPAEGQVIDAPVKFQVLARDVGQVFGLALDQSDPPNIYAASSSVLGLQIVVPDADGDGRPERIKQGQPGAQWMEGQFGLSRGGGPGTIWKINGETGEISKFADILSDGRPNSGPGLGNIAYDPKNKQFFVSDLDTGLILRLGLDGSDLGTFDHGLQGRPANGLDALQDTARSADITNPAFDSEDTGTWGLAAPGRRVWGLAVHGGRLYYAVEEGPQVWSIGITADGNFGSDPRWELDVPSDPRPYPVSDLAFRSNGQMLLAQRGGIVSRYNYAQNHAPRKTRVLRYRLEAPDDTATPSRWTAVPDDYAIGFPGNHRNSAGGIAIGYGYRKDPNGSFGFGSCEGTLWSTGDALRDNPVHAARLAQGGPTIVYGLQGNALDLVRPQNEPPWASYFVDYDSRFDDPQASGLVGDVEIPRRCGGGKRADITDLRILKRAKPVRCTTGNECAFEFEIRNTGTKTYTGPLVITDTAHDSAVLVGTPPAGWSCKEVFPGVGIFECSLEGATLEPGEAITFELTLRLPPWWKRPAYNNCVDLLVPGAGVDQRPYNNRSCDYVPICTPGDPLCVPDLLVEKFGLFGACDFAGLCEFVVRMTNVGAANYSGPLNVRDFTTTAGATLVDWTPKPDWACVAAGADSHDCTLPGPVTLAPGDFREFILLVQGPPIAPGFTHVQNCVYFDWKGVPGDPNPHNEFACAEISTLPPDHPDARPMVSIEKDAVPTCSRAAPGSPWFCVYGVKVVSIGTKPLEGPIEFSDELTPHPATLSAFAGAGWACAPAAPAAGPFTCTHAPVPGGLAPGDSLSLLIAFEIPAATPVPGWELNCATIKWDNDGDGAEEDHESCALSLVCDAGSANCPKDLALLKGATAASCPKGSDCIFGVQVENISDTNFPGPLVVNDVPDPGVGPASALTPGWACAPAGGSYTCTNPAGLPAGATAFFSVSFPILPGFGEQKFENCAEVPPGPGNDVEFNNKDCAVADVPNVAAAGLGPDLAPHSDTTCRKGQSCQLPARIDNKGNQDFTGSAGVRGTLSPALQITKVTSQTPGFTCKTTGNATYECSGNNLSVKSGDAIKYQLTVSVPANYPHSQVSHIKNMVWPDRNVKDQNPENDQHISIVNIEQQKEPPPPPPPAGQPDLAVSKSANQGACRANNTPTCAFTVNVMSAGDAPFSGPINIVDTLTPSNVVAGPANPPWRCRRQGGNYICSHPPTTLPPGQAITLSLNLRVPRGTRGAVNNCAALNWGGAQQTRASVRDVQSALAAQGFNPGPADGRPGRKTTNAIRAFQRQNRLPVTGRIDQQLLASLFGQPGGDSNPTNDRACAVASIIGQAPPPPPPQCTGGRYRNNADACICPSSRPIWTGRSCIPRPPPQCTGGRIRDNQGSCVCPADRPVWTGSTCIPRPPQQCSGGRIRDNYGNCVCPPNLPTWTGQICLPKIQVCSGGRVFSVSEGKCVCPSSKPIWSGKECIPDHEVCSGGRIYSERQRKCICPRDKPNWNGRSCVSGQCPPDMTWTGRGCACTGGRIRQGNKCVCPSNKPVWSGSQCNPGHQDCSGGRIYSERQRKCICPRSKPSWNGRQCVKYTTNPGLPPGGEITPSPRPCSGGRIRNKNGQCICPSSKPIWAGGQCRSLPGGIKIPGLQVR